MLARLTAFVIWGLVAATAVFWGLRLLVRPEPAPAYALAVGDGAAMRGDLGRLLGAAPVAALATAAAPQLSSRFKLLGIMAPKQVASTSAPGPGFALIAVDGKPARAFAVGASLDSDLVLQAVSLRTASIGPARGALAVRLEMPPLPVAATGTLPALGDGSAAAAAPVPPAPPGAMQARPPLMRPPAQPVPPAGGAVPRMPASTTR